MHCNSVEISSIFELASPVPFYLIGGTRSINLIETLTIRESEISPTGPLGVASTELQCFVDIVQFSDIFRGEINDFLVGYDNVVNHNEGGMIMLTYLQCELK